jgi:hypothetical protein
VARPTTSHFAATQSLSPTQLALQQSQDQTKQQLSNIGVRSPRASAACHRAAADHRLRPDRGRRLDHHQHSEGADIFNPGGPISPRLGSKATSRRTTARRTTTPRIGNASRTR